MSFATDSSTFRSRQGSPVASRRRRATSGGRHWVLCLRSTANRAGEDMKVSATVESSGLPSPPRAPEEKAVINSPPYGLCGASHVHTDRQDDPYRMPTKDYAVHRQLGWGLYPHPLTPSGSTTPCLLSTIYCLLFAVCCLLDYDFRRALFARMRALLCSLRVFEKMWLPSPLATK